MQDQVRIPMGFVLEMDDVGWIDGRDYTKEGKASRSGLDRNHCIEDYEYLKALTEKTGKRIAAAIVVGDWDRENFLRGEVGFTHEPHTWDQKSRVDWDYHRKCLDVLENANVDYMVHGVLHGRYDENGKRITECEYMQINRFPDGSHTRSALPEAEFRRHLDMFFKLYNSWGLKQKIKGFVIPCGNSFSDEESTEKMAKVLSEYGICYWANSFPHFPEGTTLKVYHGVACFRWGQAKPGIPWDTLSANAFERPVFTKETSPKFSCFQGTHWTNHLNLDPKKNLDNLPGWLDLYERQSQHFGSVLSDGLAEAVNQHFYYEFAEMNWEGSRLCLDLSEVLHQALDCHKKEFFLSVKKGLTPKECQGGTLSLYEEKKEFNTYKICHEGEKLSVLF